MARVDEMQALAASAEEVWRLIGGYDALSEWHPAVERSALEDAGRVRRLSLRGGGALLERLHAFSEREHSYAYSIEEGPLPVANYRSTLSVRDRGGKRGCEVFWSGDFAPAGATESEAVAVIRGIYRAGLDTLAKRFGDAS
jgi:Polyketide cyclase / dehydrase and lipid transport